MRETMKEEARHHVRECFELIVETAVFVYGSDGLGL